MRFINTQYSFYLQKQENTPHNLSQSQQSNPKYSSACPSLPHFLQLQWNYPGDSSILICCFSLKAKCHLWLISNQCCGVAFFFSCYMKNITVFTSYQVKLFLLTNLHIHLRNLWFSLLLQKGRTIRRHVSCFELILHTTASNAVACLYVLLVCNLNTFLISQNTTKKPNTPSDCGSSKQIPNIQGSTAY